MELQTLTVWTAPAVTEHREGPGLAISAQRGTPPIGNLR